MMILFAFVLVASVVAEPPVVPANIEQVGVQPLIQQSVQQPLLPLTSLFSLNPYYNVNPYLVYRNLLPYHNVVPSVQSIPSIISAANLQNQQPYITSSRILLPQYRSIVVPNLPVVPSVSVPSTLTPEAKSDVETVLNETETVQPVVKTVEVLAPLQPIVLNPGSRIDIRDKSGQYSHGYQDVNGTTVSEEGTIRQSDDGTDVTIIKQGAYSYISPEGIPVSVKYIADKHGFRTL